MADTAYTLAAIYKTPLALAETAAHGFTNKFSISYSLIASGTGTADTVTVTLGTTPTVWMVDKAVAIVSTAFAGTTGFAVTVGTTTTVAAFISSQSVLTAGVLNGVSTLPVLTTATGTAAKSLVAVFTNSGGGAPANLTAGYMDIYLSMHNMAKGAIG